MSYVYVVRCNHAARECMDIQDCLQTIAALAGSGFSFSVDVVEVPEREEVSDER